MSTITAVLLIPNDEHRALLGEGPCGARPPLVNKMTNPGSWHKQFGVHLWKCREEMNWDGTRALVLAWDGKVVIEGMDRLYRRLGARPEHMDVWPHPHTIVQAFNAERARPHSWGGSLVLLDESGAEVSP